MPTVIDSLVVTLGIDPRGFKQGKAENSRQLKQWKNEIAETEAQIRQIRLNGTKATRTEDQKALLLLRDQVQQKKKAGAEVEKFQKAEIARQKQLGEQVGVVKDQFLGLLAVFGLSVGIADFVKSTIAANAAIGRIAPNLNLSTESLSAWQGALREIGGTSADAVNSLQSLVTLFQDITLRGDTSKLGDLQGLGLQVGDLQNPADALLKLADAKDRLHLSDAEFFNRASALGITPSTIYLLEKGRDAVQDYLNAAAQAYSIHKQDADAAADAQRELSLLSDTYKRLGNSILNEALPYLIQFGSWATNNGPAVEGAIGGLAVALVAFNTAAIAAAAPILGVASAFALIGAGISSAIQNYREWQTLTDTQQASQTSLGASILNSGQNEGQLIQGAAAAAKATATRSTAPLSRAAAIEAGLRARGLTAEQARGVTAGIVAESKGDPNAFNPAGGGQGAHYLGQWRGTRLAAIRAKYGNNPTRDQQLDFLVSELRGGDPGGSKVLGQTSATGVLTSYINDLMRPRSGAAGDLARGGAYLRHAAASGGTSVDVSITNLNVNAPQATDAAGIAKGLAPAIKKYTFVDQANTGLQ